RTTAYPLVEEAAKRFSLTIAPDPNPSAGLFYRSDHFSYARVGIPAFSVEEGRDLLGRPAGTGEQLYNEGVEKRYHQPTDKSNEGWDFSGMEEYARFGLLIGVNVANAARLPTWRAGEEV